MAFRPPNPEQLMESDARFDLTTALSRWTGDFAKRGHLEPEKIAELESHLHDSIAGLQQRGLDEAESFLIATRRLGSPVQIEAEFEKAETTLLPRRALWWLILGVAGWTALGAALGTLESLLTLLGGVFVTNQMTFAAFIGATKLLTFGLFAWTLLAVANRHPRFQILAGFVARHPWRLVLLLLATNGLCRGISLVSSALLFRQVSVSRAGQFAVVLSYGSLFSSVASLAIILLILRKVRTADLAS